MAKMSSPAHLLEKIEEEQRQEVRVALKSLADGQTSIGRRQDELAEHFSQMKADNERQHGELSTRLEQLHGKSSAEIAMLTEQVRLALATSTEKLEAKNKIIRGLCYVVVAMMGVLIGIRGHAVGFLKDFWP